MWKRSWMSQQWVYFVFLLLLTVVVNVLYEFCKVKVSIYVDNGGAEAFSVQVDGTERLNVAPGAVKVIKLRSYGDRRITVVSGGETVFDSVKHFEQYEGSTFLINHRSTNRYFSRRTQYGSAFPQFRIVYDDSLGGQFRDLARQVGLLEPAEWYKVSARFVLESPPQQIAVHKSVPGTTESVLSRLDRKTFEFLMDARSQTEVTEADYRNLEKLVERVNSF